MRRVVQGLRIFGAIWLTLAVLIVLASYVFAALTEGVGRLFELLNPFNVFNYLAVVLTLSPGLLARHFANKLERRSETKA